MHGTFIDDAKPVLSSHRLWPDSFSKPQPEFIPAPLREDYYEACRIRDLSPKAAATLCRRCLQGMIRDFAGVEGRTLHDEITKLRKAVDDGVAPNGVSPESVDALDHIRSIGNMGAHMEKDINVIVPVDAEEAQILIEVIESLFEDWYVRQFRRQSAFDRVKQIASAKAQARLSPPQDG